MNGMSDDLDALLAKAARTRPALPEALQARILADAAALQPRPPAAARAVRQGWLATLADILGGSGALAGMAAAALAGLYIGVSQPAPLTALTSALWNETPLDSLDLLPGVDALLAQE